MISGKLIKTDTQPVSETEWHLRHEQRINQYLKDVSEYCAKHNPEEEERRVNQQRGQKRARKRRKAQ